MKDILASIAEVKIREAIEKGEFKNLAGAGKPLVLDNLAFVPQELRAFYKVMKNSGLEPVEVSLRKEVEELRSAIQECPDNQKQELIKKLRETEIRLSIMMEKMRKR